MFKWSSPTADEEPVRSKKILRWLLIFLLLSALAVGLYPWLALLSRLPQYRQSLMLWRF
ncbi:MAG: hypothetical protein ACOX4N_06185 [Dethiobacteraceae bacterium]|jgi:hypothetical protein|nr:hypothetical protein [Bacillota bacterium]